jgi:DNA-binding MarR family transcriptional regulator
MKRPSGHHRSLKLTKSDYEALAQFRYLMRRFSSFSEGAARGVGLTTQQHQALLAIRGFPGRARVTVGELAERLNVRHHSVVGLIDRLAARALVHRLRDATDGRRVLLELGPRGRKLLVGLSLVHRDELRRLAPILKRLLAHVE